MAAIEARNLTKHYGDVKANRGLSFSVAEGEVFGYLGPNGAGKTTTIRTLLGLQSPTDGTATVLGADVRDEAEMVEAKRRIGYLPHPPAFDEGATGREILDLHAAVKGDERSDELLDLFGPPMDRTVREYSSGNVQKLGLVLAFVHDPDLVVMDEPTSGLDPLMQRRFNEFVRAEKRAGTTVFLSSHVLGEVRRVCDRVGIIRDGRLVTTESVESLVGRSGKFVRLRVAGPLGDGTGDGGVEDLDGVHDLETATLEADGSGAGGGDGDGATDEAGAAPADAVAATAADTVTEATFTYTGDVNALVDRVAGYDLLDLDVEEAPLEDVFLRFYGGAD